MNVEGKRSEELENSVTEMDELRGALAEDLRPLGDALLAAYQSGDFAAMTGALKKISKRMPELAGDARELSMALAVKMAGAWVGESNES